MENLNYAHTSNHNQGASARRIRWITEVEVYPLQKKIYKDFMFLAPPRRGVGHTSNIFYMFVHATILGQLKWVVRIE